MKKPLSPFLEILAAPELNAEAAPVWIELAPFGAHPTRDGGAVQLLDADSAAELVSYFNFWPRRIARLMEINACPVWLGHPDFAPEIWPDKLRLGSVVELAVKNNALHGRIEWNADGLELLATREHRFPSVAWECETLAPGKRRPFMLWSVGVWKSPNIKNTAPIINADTSPETQHPTPDTMKDKLLALLVKLGLLAETPDNEETALAELETTLASNAKAVEELSIANGMLAAIADAAKPLLALLGLDAAASVPDAIAAAVAKLAETTSGADELKTEINALKASRVELALATALQTGAITKAQTPDVRTKLNANFETALAEINAATPRLNMESLKLPHGARSAAHDARERRVEINAWIDEKMSKTGLAHADVFKLAKAEFPEHFKKAVA